jgi:hypothetical protein
MRSVFSSISVLGAVHDTPHPEEARSAVSKDALRCCIAAIVLITATAAAADTIPEPTALLQGLDKTSARVSKFEAPLDTPVRFGDLSIVVRDCEKNPPDQRPENAAFLEITELRTGEKPKLIFTGWMFSSSPALSALENPIYDVNVLDCEAPPPPPAPPAPPPTPAAPARKSPR